MDQRLKDVHTADLGETQVNEDFVTWLKTKGPNYLLVGMVVIAGYLFLIRWQQSKAAHRGDAWIAFLEARASGLPASLEDVSATFDDVDGLGSLGLLHAADAYLQAVVSGRTLGADPTLPASLGDEDRTFYLQKARGLYGQVAGADDGSLADALMTINARNGEAAAAEAQGELDAAATAYQAAADRADEHYPKLAELARSRIAELASIGDAAALPTAAEVAARNGQVIRRDPRQVNPVLDGLVEPGS